MSILFFVISGLVFAVAMHATYIHKDSTSGQRLLIASGVFAIAGALS